MDWLVWVSSTGSASLYRRSAITGWPLTPICSRHQWWHVVRLEGDNRPERSLDPLVSVLNIKQITRFRTLLEALSTEVEQITPDGDYEKRPRGLTPLATHARRPSVQPVSQTSPPLKRRTAHLPFLAGVALAGDLVALYHTVSSLPSVSDEGDGASRRRRNRRIAAMISCDARPRRGRRTSVSTNTRLRRRQDQQQCGPEALSSSTVMVSSRLSVVRWLGYLLDYHPRPSQLSHPPRRSEAQPHWGVEHGNLGEPDESSEGERLDSSPRCLKAGRCLRPNKSRVFGSRRRPESIC